MPSSDPTASLADVHDDRADEIERSSRISSPARDNEPRDTATKTGVAGARELMLQQRQESLRSPAAQTSRRSSFGLALAPG
jgi:hypothetical protein